MSAEWELAHAAIDAGRLGAWTSSTHMLQGIEQYKRKNIVYNLAISASVEICYPSDMDTMIFPADFYSKR